MQAWQLMNVLWAGSMQAKQQTHVFWVGSLQAGQQSAELDNLATLPCAFELMVG